MKVKNWIVQIYLFLIFGIFPLYYQNRYYNMGEAKYEFFKYSTMGMLCLLGAAFLFNIMVNEQKLQKFRFSVQDWTVILYMMAVGCSWLLSPYRGNAWSGSPEWYMGLLSQLLFCAIYFCVSRYGGKREWTLWSMMIGGIFTCLISYLHRFQIDPLGLYEGVAEKYWITFLGTIGNANWYSSYLSVIFPVIIGMYIFGEHQKIFRGNVYRMVWILFMFLGFASAVTQNSDSIYAGLTAAFLIFLWFAVTKLSIFKRLWEVLIFGVLAVKVTGYLQSSFPESAIKVSKLSTEIAQGRITEVLAVILVLGYLGICIWEAKICDAAKDYQTVKKWVRKIRNTSYLLLLMLLILLPVLMWLVTTEKIILNSDGLLSQTGYLVFNNKWGNNRGKIWKYAMRIFTEYTPQWKIFGCGPDALMWYSKEFHQAEVQKLWKDILLTNVHNEWLNVLINCGIIGAVSYISIFGVCVIGVLKNAKRNLLLIPFAGAVLSYAAHNFFCFQQVAGTPLVFIIIAMAEYELKNIKRKL